MKVNFHFIDRCNFKCKYCFIMPIVNYEMTKYTMKLIDNLSKEFDEINFVGGEPTLHDDLEDFVRYAKRRFKSVSIVTNGYKFIRESNKFDLSLYDSIGISMDFLNKEDNASIGRNRGGESLDMNDYKLLAENVRKAGAKFKINLMVSKLNYDKKIDVSELKPDRIKVLGIMKMKDHSDDMDYSVTKEQYDHFINSNDFSFCSDVVKEGPGSMIDAYHMVLGNGDMVNNSNSEYEVIGNWLKDDPKDIMKKNNILIEKYNKRY